MISVFLGGGLGAILRYLISIRYNKKNNPKGTLLVNLSGCFLFGLLSALFIHEQVTRNFLLFGFCGGYTTFSTFSNEITCLDSNKLKFLYIFVSIFCGMLLVFLGSSIPNFFS